MPFKSGSSGNPAGRPKGAKDKRTAIRELLEPHIPKLIKKAVTLALKDDTAALRLCLERVMPPLRATDRAIELSGLIGTLAQQSKRVVEAVAAGEISPDQGATLMQTLSAQARIIEVDELERRIAALERRNSESPHV
jgi:polyhydroxyalkanoate synthesis regulator phasin